MRLNNYAELPSESLKNIENGEKHGACTRNSFFKTALSHRTYREFTDEPVSPADLEALLEAVRWTASSTGQQRYSIIRVTKPELREEIAQICCQAYLARTPELWIFVADVYRNTQIAAQAGASTRYAYSMDKFFQAFTDSCLAAQNLVNAAESLGYGTVCIGSLHNNTQKINKLLELPQGCVAALGVGFGRPAQAPQQKPRIPHVLRFFENTYPHDLLQRIDLKPYDELMKTYYDLRDTSRRVDSFTLQCAKACETYIPGREEILQSVYAQGFIDYAATYHDEADCDVPADKNPKNYLIIGCGGVGAPLAAKLTEHKRDLSIIARGEHLQALKDKGLTITSAQGSKTYPVHAYDSGEFEALNKKVDVIIVAVKAYSLDALLPFIKKVSHPSTIVIPLLNAFGTGKKLRKAFGERPISLDGIIYVAAHILDPGCVEQNSDASLLKIVMGLPEADSKTQALVEQAAEDMRQAGINVKHSPEPEKDCFAKYSFISPYATSCIYYGLPSEALQHPGEERETFKALTQEIIQLGGKLGIELDEGQADKNLAILDKMSPDTLPSTYRDVADGKESEIYELVYQVGDLAKEHGVDLPVYERIIEEIKRRQAKKR